MFLTVIKPWKVFEPNTTLMNSHFEKKGNLVIPSDKAYITFDQQKGCCTPRVWMCFPNVPV